MNDNKFSHFPESALSKALRAVQKMDDNSFEFIAFQNGKKILHYKNITNPSLDSWDFIGLDEHGKSLWQRMQYGTQWIAISNQAEAAL